MSNSSLVRLRSDGFCVGCASIALTSIVHTELASPRNIAIAAILDQLTLQTLSKCALCMNYEDPRKLSNGYVSMSKRQICECTWKSGFSYVNNKKKKDGSPFLANFRVSKKLRLKAREAYHINKLIGELAPRVSGNVPTIVSWERKGDSVDFEMIKRWLRHYDDSDQDHCKPRRLGESISHSDDFLFQVVDCQTRKVIKATAPSECQYVALSYVWGAPASNDSLLKGSPPTVVEDAIYATLELGFQYLWIDRYCVSRDRLVKHHQLRQMGSIYKEAAVTLIAAAGVDAMHGLPGVRGKSCRDFAMALEVGGCALVSDSTALVPYLRPRERLESLVQHSKWLSRGWTFQEAILSRRRLYFTEGGVLLECNKTIHSELERVRNRLPEEYFRSTRMMPLLEDMTSPTVLYNSIESYSQREFTLEGDILDAFLGIFEELRRLGNPYYSYWGIPVFTDVEVKSPVTHLAISPKRFCENLVRGMRWISSPNAPRRSGFPSWSWTGWSAPVSFHKYWSTTDDKALNTCIMGVFAESMSGELLGWPEMESLSESNTKAFKLNTFIHVDCWTVDLEFMSMSDILASYGNCMSFQMRIYSETDFFLPLKISSNETAFIPVHLTDQVANGMPKNRLFTKRWKGVLLQEDEDNFFLLIVGNQTGHMERIGAIISNFNLFDRTSFLLRKYETFTYSSDLRFVSWNDISTAFRSIPRKRQVLRLG